MAVPIWRGEIRDNRLHFERRAEFDAYSRTLDGKRFELVLRKEKRHLSGNQRRYLHGVIFPVFGEAIGQDPIELKVLLKLKFLWDGEMVDKSGLPVVPSTEELDSKQYGEFIDQCVRLAAECGCVIPAPNDAE